MLIPLTTTKTEAAVADPNFNNQANSVENEGSSGKHESHQLEVEVLLYRFKQPVAEVSWMLFIVGGSVFIP